MDNPLESYRADFPSLSVRRNGKPPIYLDNACTTLVPRQVIEAMDEYYRGFPACSGARSHHWFAQEVSCRIEGDPDKGTKGSRQLVADFINARSPKEIIFTMNTTHAINTVAIGFKFNRGDVVLISDKEHNSNLIPWLRLQKAAGIEVQHTDRAPDDMLDMASLEQKLKSGRVKLVSMGYTSNATGYTLPAKEVVTLAHRYGAKVLLDGAQTVPHRTVDVQALDVDFLAFSIHKLCGPRGVGVLYAKKEMLGSAPREKDDRADVIQPAFLGGGTVHDTTFNSYSLVEPPERFETGTQNYAGLIGTGAALSYLKQIGMDRIHAHEVNLNTCLTDELLGRYEATGWFHIIGQREATQRGGILTFEVKRPNAVGIAEDLSDKSNIMIRDGVFCAHSYFNDLYGQGWTRPKSHSEHRMVYRVSFYFYSTLYDCQVFLDTLDEIFRERSYI